MTATPPPLQQVRAALWGHLSSDVAHAAEMDLADLHKLVAGQYRP